MSRLGICVLTWYFLDDISFVDQNGEQSFENIPANASLQERLRLAYIVDFKTIGDNNEMV